MVKLFNQHGIDIGGSYVYELDRDIAFKAYEACLDLWPEEVGVTEQISEEEDACYIPNLSHFWNEAEESIEGLEKNIEGIWDENNSSTQYMGVVNDAIFGVLHKKAIGNEVVYPKKVSFADIEKRIIKDYLGWKHQKPPEVNDDNIITIEWQTGRIISIENPDRSK